MQSFERDKVAMAELTMKLRALDISDRALLAALEMVPRRLFVPAAYVGDAYLDRAIPIECGQTLPAPSIQAKMLAALDPRPGDRVLEIGTGSGFQAAILHAMGAEVVTLDRYRTLIDLAKDRFLTMKAEKILAAAADGLEGYVAKAPYDRIILNGSLTKLPPSLMDQLTDKGVLVAPIGIGRMQMVTRIIREGRLFRRVSGGSVRFVPLVEGLAKRL